jgi:hypothetical protein
MLALADFMRGGTLSEETIRADVLRFPASTEVRDEILARCCLDQPCPVPTGASGGASSGSSIPGS